MKVKHLLEFQVYEKGLLGSPVIFTSAFGFVKTTQKQTHIPNQTKTLK